MTKVPGTI